MAFILPSLPPIGDLETRAVLRKAANAHRYLAELKGVVATIPNELILINTLTIQEAKDSSAVENIITTHDDLFQAELFADVVTNPAVKEVQRYASALKKGFDLVRKQRMLTLGYIKAIQEELEQNQAWFRKLPGTNLRDGQTGEVVCTPPQDADEILALMANLELFINDDALYDADPLVKMAILHYQFESIHPFYDGNGRTGRIINVLFLILHDLLPEPILYLSEYITDNKGDYYRLLQAVRTDNNWSDWIVFMLKAVEATALQTIDRITAIQTLFEQTVEQVRTQLPKIYSKELIELLFEYPYSKIDYVVERLVVDRRTASKYLHSLAEIGVLRTEKRWKETLFVNTALFDLLRE